MIGAIIGDIVGSVYEFNNIKTKEFQTLTMKNFFTDDTIMTIAVAEALMNGGSADNFIDSMKKFGRLYPNADWGGLFRSWLFSDDRKPYDSFGNGSAMRVSPCAWFAKSLEEAERLAELSASVTHNHPEGIKGAKAVAGAIYLARTGCGKPKIKEYVEKNYGYNLNRTLDEIRPSYRFDETCQGTVPEAIIAFLESKGFEDAIRNAVSLGGDSDTLAAITGSISEASGEACMSADEYSGMAYGDVRYFLTDVFDILDRRLIKVINDWHDAGLPVSSVAKAADINPDRRFQDIREPRATKVDIRLSQGQFARLRYGRISTNQNQKWDSYFENGRLHIFRVGLGRKYNEAAISKYRFAYRITEIVTDAAYDAENKDSNGPKCEADAIALFCEYQIPYFKKSQIKEIVWGEPVL
jgi:ADP-ribosylglycohydrolase